MLPSTPNPRKREGCDDGQENGHNDEAERKTDARLGHEFHGSSGVDKRQFVRMKSVVNEFEADETENRGQTVMQEDDAFKQPVNQEVELTQPQQ